MLRIVQRQFVQIDGRRLQSEDGTIVHTSYGHGFAACEYGGKRYLIPKETNAGSESHTVHLYLSADSAYQDGAFGTPIEESMLRQLRQDLRAAFEAAGHQVVLRY